MPTNIRIIYWNVENFGDPQAGRRGNYIPLCNFIARVVKNVDADILCLMEVRHTAPANRLRRLQLALLNAYNVGGNQTCDWYCDWVPGSLLLPPYGAPFDPNDVDFIGQGRNEGYAVFWKQNLDKFLMQRADRIITANATPPAYAVGANVRNRQSGGVRRRGGAAGTTALGGHIIVPAGINQFSLPAGSIPGAGGITRGAGGALVAAAGVATPGVTQLYAGDFIPVGTQIATTGVRFNNVIAGAGLAAQPIVIPGNNYILTNNVTLPAIGATVISRRVLSLVLTSRQTAGGVINNYVPGGANNWELGSFPSTGGANYWNGTRRPAFCTIKINSAAPAAQRLIPIIFYHAPLADPPRAMGRCAIAQPLYEAMDLGAPPYIHNSRAVVGGDFNARLLPFSNHYTIYTNGYAAGGANCHDAGNQNIRVNYPAPAFPPGFPPPGVPPTAADNPKNKSSIQLRHPIRGPNLVVLSPFFNHFRRGAIDNIFYRGFTAAQAPHFQFRANDPVAGRFQFEADVYDLLRAVSGEVPPGGVGIGMGAPPDNFFIPPGILNAFAVLGMGAPAILNAAQLLADLNLGIFQTAAGGDPAAPVAAFSGPGPAVLSPARRAAEFVKLFVSDHLPVIFQMVI